MKRKINADLLVFFFNSFFAGQHVIKPVEFSLREEQVHQLANSHQCQQL